MKRKNIGSLLYAALGLAAAGVLGVFVSNDALADNGAQTVAASSAKVDVKALTGGLQFLGGQPNVAGHPMLVEFWATWCPPCRASISHMNELYEKYHAKGLEIVGVSDEDKGTVERFREHTPMHYNVALDTDQKLAMKFNVSAIPHAMLLDKDGRVVWSGHPMALDEKAIAAVLTARPAL